MASNCLSTSRYRAFTTANPFGRDPTEPMGTFAFTSKGLNRVVRDFVDEWPWVSV